MAGEYYVNHGEDCPVCGAKGKAEHVAVLRIQINGYDVDPDEYAICTACHAKQYKQRYGYAPGKVPPPPRLPRSARTG